MSNRDNQQQPGVAPGDWKRELTNLLQLKGRVSAGKRTPKPISDRTLDAREAILFMCMRQVRGLGYDIKSVYSLRGRHVEALVEKWKTEGVGAGAIQNRLAILRALSKWIGKEGMVLPTRHYALDNPERLRRRTSAKEDKSWSAKGIDPEKVFAAVTGKDQYVAMQLRLMEAFALRREEAIQFKPNKCHEGDQLRVRDGTKGGRERMIRITNDKQREVLDQAKRIVTRWDGAVAEPGRTLKQNLNRFDYIMGCVGLTKDGLGVTSHGLRHQRLNDLFEEVAGVPSPVRQMSEASGPVVIVKGDATKWKQALQIVSNTAGHSAIYKGAAYTGSARSVKRPGKPRLDWTAGKTTSDTTITLVDVSLDCPGPALDGTHAHPVQSIPDSGASRPSLENISVAFVAEHGGRQPESDQDDHHAG